MSLGLVGRKVGMTRVFAEDGTAVPVTVLDVADNRVTQIKTPETDGYAAVQVTYGKRRPSRVAKPQARAFERAGVKALPAVVLEVAAAGGDPKPGDAIAVGDVFQAGAVVDVVGTSIGHGFQGVPKRHGFNLGPQTHGTKNVREHKSTGSNTWPSRRWTTSTCVWPFRRRWIVRRSTRSSTTALTSPPSTG